MKNEQDQYLNLNVHPTAAWSAWTIHEMDDMKNLIVIPHVGIVEFKGESIPGILMIEGRYDPIKEQTDTQSRYWEVKLKSVKQHPVQVIQQGPFFLATNVPAWIMEFREILRGWMIQDTTLTDERILKALVSIYPKHLMRINEMQKNTGRSIVELLDEQDQIAHGLHLDFPYAGIEN